MLFDIEVTPYERDEPSSSRGKTHRGNASGAAFRKLFFDEHLGKLGGFCQPPCDSKLTCRLELCQLFGKVLFDVEVTPYKNGPPSSSAKNSPPWSNRCGFGNLEEQRKANKGYHSTNCFDLGTFLPQTTTLVVWAMHQEGEKFVSRGVPCPV